MFSGSPSTELEEGSSKEPRRRKGKCKWFNVVKGWGFITPDDGGQEVFVHQVSVVGSWWFLEVSDRVRCNSREVFWHTCAIGIFSILVSCLRGITFELRNSKFG